MKKLKSSLAVKITAVLLLLIFGIVFGASIFGVVYMFNDYDSYTLFTESQIYDEVIRHYAWQIYDNYYSDKNTIRNSLKANNLNCYFDVTNQENKIVFTNYSHEITNTPKYTEGYHDVKVNIYLKDTLESKNFIYYAKILFDMRYAFTAIAITAMILMIVTFVFLISAAGHRKGTDEIVPSFIDRIPIDLFVVIIIAVFAGLFDMMRWSDEIFIILLLFALYFTVILFIMSFAVRCKSRTLIKNSLIYYIIYLSYLGIKTIPLIWRAAVGIVGFLLINLFFVAIEWYAVNVILVLLAVSYVYYYAYSMYKIKVGTDKISSGDINYKIDTSLMLFDLKTIGEGLNNISSGLKNAVDERLKSEHFKSELITNVSHDLKTPLTSIINYVDLLKKEEIDNEAATEYIEVLDRQSNKLKKLTEDLIDASKASTGNVNMNITEVDIIELLGQSIGEYAEKFQSVGIEPILNLYGIETFKIKSDGRLLWRIFDNLLNNIHKYAMNNTRVYIDCTIVGESVMIGIKNISRDPLNMASDELMERFIRGDSSRTTEGSGLGLSISRSLTEILGGTFNIFIDGDLFKAVITLPC